MHRRTALRALAAAVAMLALASARAQEAGKTLLTLLVGFSAGSVPDVAARVVGKPMSEVLRRTLVVDNKAGAAGQLALAALKQAPADGSTIAISPLAALTLYPLTYAKLPYDPAKDFVPVCSVCVIDFAFAVAASHPAQTLQEFVAWCKAHPGKGSIGNPGSGSSPHFVAWSFAAAAGLDVAHVPYRAPPQIVQEVVGGALSGGMASVPLFSELVKSGRLRLLATTGTRRNSLYPQVPTFNEAGYPSVVGQECFALFAPAGTPRAVIAGMTDSVSKFVTREDIQASLAPLGLSLEVHDAAWLAERMREEAMHWRDLVARTDFKAQ